MNPLTCFKPSGLLLSLLFLTGCNEKNQNVANENWGTPELPIAIIQKGNASSIKEYATSIEGLSNIEIRPQVSGYLEKILVDEGDYVKAGQTLFLVENSIYKEQFNHALANLTTVKIDLDRKKELVKSKIVSELQVQQAEALYKAAASQVESAKINLNFCSIKAPVSGYISRIPYRLGSLVAPSNTEPLTVLSDNHKVNAYFSLSENDFIAFQKQYEGNSFTEKLKNLPPVTLIMADGEAYELKGKIDAVDGQFNKTTGSITLRAKFDNPKRMLKSGNTGKIVLEQTYNNVLLLPIASTRTLQDKIFVFSVDEKSTAIQIPIQIAGKSGNNYIISEGLKPGDKYITTGFERLQSGTPIVEKKDSK